MTYKKDDDGASRPTEPSHDPRTWFSATSSPSAKVPPQTPPDSHIPSSPPSPSSLPILALNFIRAHRWIFAGGLAAVVLLIILFVALSGHRPPSPAAAPTATPPAAADAGTLKRIVTILPGQDVPALLHDAGIVPADITAVMTRIDALGGLPTSGGRMELTLSHQGVAYGIEHLSLSPSSGTGLVLSRSTDGYAGQALAVTVKLKAVSISGQMDGDSFYTSAVSAGVPDSLIEDFANAFTFDFDFSREVHAGDAFEVVYEAPVDAEGKMSGTPQLLMVSLSTPQKSRALYRFTAPGTTEPGWFDAAGQTTRRSLMRTPVPGARVTSTYGMRFHPVLGFTRMHRGVDFGVPVGTPVFASGDGVVSFMGPHGGHGNYLMLDHDKGLQTAYAHLSRFGPGMAIGVAVRQGQVIAFSGNTGTSSGPHLHYEIKVNGEFTDPLAFQTQAQASLTGDALAAFLRERLRIDTVRAENQS